MAGTYYHTVYLTNFAGQNPFTVGSAGLVSVTSGDAIVGTAGYAWTLFNQGTIESSAASGIHLTLGGVVTNGQSGSSGGLISGGSYGVKIDGTVVRGSNYVTTVTGAGTVSNLGTIESSASAGIGVSLDVGGTIVNGASNATSALISGGLFGVTIPDGVVTVGTNTLTAGTGLVSNFGTIASGASAGIGVSLGGRGTITNHGLITASGALGVGVSLAGLGAGTVINYGTVAGSGPQGVGISMTGGKVINHGIITGSDPQGVGISITGVYLSGYVINYGTIAGASGTAVAIGSASHVILTVEPGAVFAGAIAGFNSNQDDGIDLAHTTATSVTFVDGTLTALNGGTVVDTLALTGTFATTAFLLSADGAGGTDIGVKRLEAGGPLIVPLDTTAFVSVGSATNFSLLQLDPSATLNSSGALSFDTLINQGQVNIASGDSLAFGTVAGGASSGVIDLRTGGTVDFQGSVANQTVIFNPPGGTAVIDQPEGFAGTLSGFTGLDDIVDLTQLSPAGAGAALNGSDQLVVSNGSQAVSLQLDPGESYAGIVWQTSPDAGTGTDIAVACFCRGTLILTERGEVPVEELAIGDKVVTLDGPAAPIKWIGRRSYDGRFVAGNRAVLPVRVAAGAIADSVPARDLLVSPEHALYIDGALVPARLVVNGASIAQAEAAERVEYFHLELDAPKIIFAEGMPAETFVDCDNRFMFHNAGEFAALYPGDRRPAWEFCAPRLEAGSPGLTPIRAVLLQRAEALGHAFDHNPNLHLIVDGAIVRPEMVAGCVYRFVLPAGRNAVWLASRSAVPAETTAAGCDLRRLGIPVERIALGDGELSIVACHGHTGLRQGFHEDEATHRWTDGLARLPASWLRAFPGPVTLELHLVPSELRYQPPAPARIGAAAA